VFLTKRQAKFRFRMLVDGVPKNLFSVRVRSDDQLAIILPPPKNIEWQNQNHGIVEDHYSIHGPTKGSGTTIKRTLVLDDESLIETVLFAPNEFRGWATPIYINACSTLLCDNYNSQNRLKDTHIDICSYNPNISTLVYAIIISDGEWDNRKLSDTGLGFLSRKFGRYCVNLLYMFQLLPSNHLGLSQMVMTSTPRLNRGEYAQAGLPLEWRTPEEIGNFTTALLRQTALVNAQRSAQWLADQGSGVPHFFMTLAAMYSATPP
jgi:hypothetical protein